MLHPLLSRPVLTRAGGLLTSVEPTKLCSPRQLARQPGDTPPLACHRSARTPHPLVAPAFIPHHGGNKKPHVEAKNCGVGPAVADLRRVRPAVATVLVPASASWCLSQLAASGCGARHRTNPRTLPGSVSAFNTTASPWATTVAPVGVLPPCCSVSAGTLPAPGEVGAIPSRAKHASGIKSHASLQPMKP